MTKKLTILLCIILFTSLMQAQVPFAFRYQASIRNDENKPVNSELLFNVNLYADESGDDNIYHETHTIEPDTNGLVAFSIGEGLTNNNFDEIVWADGPYYIQIMIDEEEISFSQLVSVPYAMHAATATKLHDLQEPVLENDPTTKNYVDTRSQETINNSKAYADSLAITPKDLEVDAAGDTLTIGGTKIVIPGMSADNMPKYEKQILIGGSYNENLISTYITADSSILILGTTQSNDGDISDFKGNTDIFIAHLSQNLEINWSNTLGGSAYDNPNFILEEDDGFLVVGTTESSDGDVSSNHGEFDIWLIKLDQNGNLTWEETYGGAETEFVNSVITKEDGGYYIAGSTFSTSDDIDTNSGESDLWLFEINNSHSIIKNKNIGGYSFDNLVTMQENSDGNLELFAMSSSNDGDIKGNNGAIDYVVITLSKDLEILDQSCYGTTENEQLVAVQNGTNGSLLVGNSFSNEWNANASKQSKNIYVQSIGTNNWELKLGGSQNDEIIDLKTKNDTIVLLSQSLSNDGDISKTNGAQDIWLSVLSKDGKLILEKSFGGTYNEFAKVIVPLTSGGWIIGGESESADKDLELNTGSKDIWLIELNSDYEIVSQQTFGGSYCEQLQSVWVKDDGTVFIFGTTASNDYSITGLHDMAGKSSDIWLLKTKLK